MSERWAQVTGYPGLYLISDRGRVYRLERVINRVHTGPYVQEAGFMALRVGNKLGHLCVTLYDEQGRRRKHWVHRLVATEFLPNPEGLPYVLHGIKGPAYNHVENIRWGNQSDNERDKLRHKVLRQEARHG
jgi:hypothetical protein